LPRISLSRDVALVLGFSIFIALSAQIAVFLPFNPLVPITGQTLAVLLTGAVLGSRRGSLSVLAYIGQGALGLPVFASGTAGLLALVGPRAGYLWGFVVAAFIVGWLAERRWDRRPLTMAAAMVFGNIAIYTYGVSWLAFYTGGLATAFSLGFLPFVIGDVLKIAIATATLPSAWKFITNVR
jgi:biotin transport system substrate-specific component